MTVSLRVRPFSGADFDAVIALMRLTLSHDAPSPARLGRDFLLDPGFRADDLLIAEQNATVTGYLLAPRLRSPTPVDTVADYRSGWIVAFGVHPESRRQGVAGALLNAAIGRGSVARWHVADLPVRYLIPGIDRAAFPAAHALLINRFGFRLRDRVASMGRSLSSLNTQSEPTLPIRPLTVGDIPQLRDWLLEQFGWSWWWYLARSLDARLAGDPTPSAVLVAWDGANPVGVVHYRGERFGPLAVDRRAQGQGLGSQLTLAALAAMRAHGLCRAYFLLASAERQAFYQRVGFHPLRYFDRLTKGTV